MRITWFGTASLAVETAAGALLVDPYFPMKGSSTRVDRAAYRRFGHILVTHGHFDHIQSLPDIVAESGATVYCTRTPRGTLVGLGVPEDRLREIAPGEGFSIGDMEIGVFHGRHVKYDGRLLLRTFLNPRMLRYAGNLPGIVRAFRSMPENGEIVAYCVRAEGKRVLILGSLGLDEAVDYPREVDLLVLPYQGTSDLMTPARRIVDALRPRTVLLDHFDDAFPPISCAVDTDGFRHSLADRLPVHRLEPGQWMEI